MKLTSIFILIFLGILICCNISFCDSNMKPEIALVWDDVNGLIYAGTKDGISMDRKYIIVHGDVQIGDFEITELYEDYAKGICKPYDTNYKLEKGDIVIEKTEEIVKTTVAAEENVVIKENIDIVEETKKEESVIEENISGSLETKEEMEKIQYSQAVLEWFSENGGAIFCNILKEKNEEKKIRDIVAIYNEAEIFTKAGLIKDAVQVYEKGLSLDDTNLTFLNNAAVLSISVGDYNKALSFLRKAVLISPRDYVFHRNMAILYAKKSLWDEALYEVLKSKELGDTFSEKLIDLISKLKFSQVENK